MLLTKHELQVVEDYMLHAVIHHSCIHGVDDKPQILWIQSNS